MEETRAHGGEHHQTFANNWLTYKVVSRSPQNMPFKLTNYYGHIPWLHREMLVKLRQSHFYKITTFAMKSCLIGGVAFLEGGQFFQQFFYHVRASEVWSDERGLITRGVLSVPICINGNVLVVRHCLYSNE
jgi:hypothetical protein